jgi:hypothetical protein
LQYAGVLIAEIVVVAFEVLVAWVGGERLREIGRDQAGLLRGSGHVSHWENLEAVARADVGIATHRPVRRTQAFDVADDWVGDELPVVGQGETRGLGKGDAPDAQ